MELRHLRYFLVVAEELHFGRAAERLHISQPPLSVTIQTLERELGTALFRRSTRQVSLTPAGEAFRKRIAPLLADIDAAVDEVKEVREGIRGRLAVGYVSSASYSILPGAMQLFRRRLPRVELSLTPLTSGQQLSALLADELDVGILRDSGAVPGLHQEHVITERLVVILPSLHPLAHGATVTPGQLRGEPLVLFSYDLMPGYVSRIMTIFNEEGIEPVIAQQAIHQETVMGLVAAGVGLSILPESVAGVLMPGVVMRPFSSTPTTSLGLAWHGEIGPAARVFADCVHQASSPAGLPSADAP